MNWKKLVETKNAKTYILPEGWDSRDTISEQLECSPEKVRDHLRPALKSGEVLEQQFKVWSAELSRCVMVTAYKQADAKPDKQPKPTASIPFDLGQAQRMKASGKSYAEIGQEFGMSGDSVRARLRRAA